MAIKVEAGVESGPELDQEIGQELDQFDEYFRGLGNEPLSRSEAAIIKTFLVYKLLHEKR